MQRTVYVKQKKRRLFLRRIILLTVTALTAMITMYGGLLLYAQITGAPSLSVPKASVFLDQDGKVIGDHFAAERRYWVELDEISPFLIDAVVATEDRHFHSHHGFDYKRIAGALLKDIKNRKKVEGASTITQQYARNLHLTHAKTWKRKINEALIAFRLERFYDKEVILEGYLNTVYFGHGMYGVEAASNFYFGKSAKELTLEESAVITAIAKGPSIYSPVNYPENSTRRKELIISLMEAQGVISTEQATRAMETDIVLKADEWRNKKKIAPYFLDEVWREAEKVLAAKGRYPAEGGWTIRTTLNAHHQQIAEEVIEKWMPDNGLQIGFTSIDPATGGITSLVGGTDYTESPFNRATQARRQPGSVIKPVLYAAALENGFNPLTFLMPEKTIFTYDNGETYEPKNVNGKFASQPISLAQALAISDNIYAVKTLEDVGYKNFQGMAERLGIDVNFPTTPATALGTTEVTLMDMTNAYNRVAAGGVDITPNTIISITDAEGKTIYERPKQKKKQIMSEQDAFVLTHLMTGMFDPVFNDYSAATGLSMRQKQTRPYAAKSGTTITDQYLIGFTPSLTAGVWNGFDVDKQLETIEDKAATKKIWIEFMEEVHSGKTPEPFIPPKGVSSVIVDVETGGLAVAECERQRLVYVKEKDVPQKLCTDQSLQQMKSSNKDEKGFNLFPFSFFD
ncbi:transglycosylase domain-containing protein [Sporosarcina pasteurii]|uniref:Penicillin-binding protein 1A/1B n=1 Tax=Sporosarcina pasteurii TaxID=1474 RepID=A0A380BE79_SPOPA|nr:PBP1A family penicillin-binding protein [Sporosarcina pasteurii]MDS9472322.1 PBP1A family penicillin-binding protein [Sporosarcina pasteurii]QBQ06301.1 PBP1A family penicillin-binding protein [Sporosarcina pasteurii]SUI99040.1 Penicillin-binding protein 1A/1B [Sporosarcina pasteurii]